MAAINAAENSANGGGTVSVPAGTYVSNTLTLRSNIDLQLASGAIIQSASPSSTLVTAASGHDMAITGSGTIDGHATATSSNNLVSINGVNNLLVSGVTIANSSHEHLVVEGDNNVTISRVTINDNYTTAQTGGYLANTDGIDFAGQHFLITGSTVDDGDDDICAKPGSHAVGDVTITQDTIGAGHGISVGGQTGAGLNGMTVSNVTFNGTVNGLRLKAGQGQGGVVENITYSNITMTGVGTPIIINSWYQNGDKYGSKQLSPSALHNLTNPGETPIFVNQLSNSASYPFFDNISYSNITATGASQNVAILYGLDSFPSQASEPLRNIDGVSFNNVHLSGSYGADIYYVSNLDLSGLTATATSGNSENLYGDSPSVWATAIGGSWSTGPWNSTPAPNGAGEGAIFNAATTAALTVSLDVPVTLGTLQFVNSASAISGYTLSGANTLTLDNSGSTATIGLSGGSHSIDAPVVLANGLVISGSSGTLHFAAASSISGTGSLTMNGSGGTLILSGTDSYNGATIVNAGTLEVESAAALPTGTSLSIGNTSSLSSFGRMDFAAVVGGQTAATVPSTSTASVPEPGTIALFVAGAALITACYRRRTLRQPAKVAIQMSKECQRPTLE
jgi:autotransporter-associated beta strand protein